MSANPAGALEAGAVKRIGAVVVGKRSALSPREPLLSPAGSFGLQNGAPASLLRESLGRRATADTAKVHQGDNRTANAVPCPARAGGESAAKAHGQRSAARLSTILCSLHAYSSNAGSPPSPLGSAARSASATPRSRPFSAADPSARILLRSYLPSDTGRTQNGPSGEVSAGCPAKPRPLCA